MKQAQRHLRNAIRNTWKLDTLQLDDDGDGDIDTELSIFYVNKMEIDSDNDGKADEITLQTWKRIVTRGIQLSMFQEIF